MTVGELESTMSNGEFVKWVMYYQKKAKKAELQNMRAKRRG